MENGPFGNIPLLYQRPKISKIVVNIVKLSLPPLSASWAERRSASICMGAIGGTTESRPGGRRRTKTKTVVSVWTVAVVVVVVVVVVVAAFCSSWSGENGKSFTPFYFLVNAAPKKKHVCLTLFGGMIHQSVFSKFHHALWPRAIRLKTAKRSSKSVMINSNKLHLFVDVFDLTPTQWQWQMKV